MVEPVGLGIIGLGRGFMLTLPTLTAHPGVRLTGAADPRPRAREAFAAQFDGRAYADVSDLLEDPRVEAVYIASPHQYHHEQAMAALHKGRHVLVEKPMAPELGQCRSMTKAALEAGRTLIVGPSHGFDAPVSCAAGLIASGRVGRVRMITAFNFTDYVYRPRRREELGSAAGGVVLGQGTHQIDVVRRLVLARPVAVHAVIGDWDPNRTTVGAYHAHLSFEDGTVASLSYSGYDRYDSNELQGWISELGFPQAAHEYGAARRRVLGLAREQEEAAKHSRTFGESGTVVALPPHHEHFGWVLASCERGDLRLTPDGVHVYGEEGYRFMPVPPPSGGREAVIDAFVRAIRFAESPIFDGEWGTITVACCEAILRSASEQREVTVARDPIGMQKAAN